MKITVYGPNMYPTEHIKLSIFLPNQLLILCFVTMTQGHFFENVLDLHLQIFMGICFVALLSYI